MTALISHTYLAGVLQTARYYKDLAERAITQVPDGRLHEPLDENTNSIAVIMQHMAGNLASRWTDFLTTDGEKPARDRDGEFVDRKLNRAELLDLWNRGWNCLLDQLSSLSDDDLRRTVTIRGEPHSVPLAIERGITHAAYHVGQIVLIARLLAGDQWTVLTMPKKR